MIPNFKNITGEIMVQNFKLNLLEKIKKRTVTVSYWGKTLWNSKIFSRLSLVTNGLCLNYTVNKLVGSPMPTIVNIINLSLKYTGNQNLFGLIQIIFMNNILFTSIEVGVTCNLILFICCFFFLIGIEMRADQKTYTNKVNTLETTKISIRARLRNISVSKYIELSFVASKFSMVGFVGIVTSNCILMIVYKDLYKSSRLMRYEDGEIYHSLGIRKPITLLDKIQTINREVAEKVSRISPSVYEEKLSSVLNKHPQLENVSTRDFIHGMIMMECNKEIHSSVYYEVAVDFIRHGWKEAPQEVRLYFVTSLMHANSQLRDCCKSLLP